MTRRRWECVAAALAVLIVFPIGVATAGETDVLVRKVVGAYGGKVGLSSVIVLRETGRVVSRRSGVEGEILRVYRYPGDLRVEIAYPGMEKEVRVLNGKNGWRRGRRVSGPPFDAMALQAARLALPRNLLAAAGKIEDLGTVEREGKTLRVLSFPLGKEEAMRVEIDPATGRILRSAGLGGSGMESTAGGIEFVTEYGDFREVDGVLFAFREKNFAMGHHVGDTVLTRIEILAAAPPGVFNP